MANTDKSEWILFDVDLVTRKAILPIVGQSHLYFEFQEPGSGELKIPLDSRAAALVASGMFCACYYRGDLRGGFFIDNIKLNEASSNENAGRLLSVSGRGLLSILEDAIIWSDISSATTREFTNVSKASILKTLFDEAVSRGALLNVTLGFTATTSTDSVTWSDRENYRLNVGTSLLDVMRMFAKTGQVEFEMSIAGGSIVWNAYSNDIGSNKSASVYMRIGLNCEEVTSDERGDKITNALLIKFKDGYASVSDPTSIAVRRRREDLLNIEAAQRADSAITFASAELNNEKDPRRSIGIKVFDGVGPRLFVDYSMGDLITLDRLGDEVHYRVLGVQCDFDGDVYSNVTIELNWLFYENDLEIAEQLDWLQNQWNTAKDGNLQEIKQWVGIGWPNGEVYALHNVGDYLYVGGDFTQITGKASVSYIARYDTTNGAWAAMGTAITSKVRGIITDASGDLYAATDTKLYKWNGTDWDLKGTQASGSAQIYGLYSDGSDIYIFGFSLGMTSPSVINMPSGVGKFDGSTWHQVGSWIAVECYGVSMFQGDLYGAFSITAPDNNAGIMKFVSTDWAVVFASANQPGFAITATGDYLIFVYGYRTTPTVLASVNRWDGVTATPEKIGTISSGGAGIGSTFAFATYLSDIYVGDIALLTDASGPFNFIGHYSGGVWAALGDGLQGSISVSARAIVIHSDVIYVGGRFDTAGGKSTPNLAAYATSFQSLINMLENSNSFDMGAAIHAAPASAISDNDEVPFWEDVSNALRKITWGNIKSALLTAFGSFFLKLDGSNTLTDQLNIVNAHNGNGGIYAQTVGDAYTADIEQYTTDDDVTSPAHFIYRGTDGTGDIHSPMIEGMQTESGTGVIDGDFINMHDDTTSKAFRVDKDGNIITTGSISGTFTTVDGKTITVTGGVITSIV